MHSFKAPELDGFLEYFFRVYCETISEQMVCFVQETFQTCFVYNGINKSLLF